MDDDGSLVGIHNIKKLSEDIPNKIKNHLGIAADVNLHYKDGLDYIEIVVEPHPMPISYHGKYYYRSGSVKTELTGASLDTFLLKTIGKSWDCTLVTNLAVDDLSLMRSNYFEVKHSKVAG